MMRRGFGTVFLMLGFLAVAGALMPVTANADNTGSFAGTVAYINPRHIGVRSGQHTRDFLIPGDFDNVVRRNENTKVAYSSIKTGEFVTVRYLRSPLFGSTQATKIIVGGNFLNAFPSTLTARPLPSVSPPR